MKCIQNAAGICYTVDNETGENLMKRLDKILSDAGVAARRELKGIIKAGRVTVDGVVVREADRKIEAKKAAKARKERKD